LLALPIGVALADDYWDKYRIIFNDNSLISVEALVVSTVGREYIIYSRKN
jgi:hypothetical protein